MELDHVSFQFPGVSATIQDITASVPTGQILSIIGPNGAGKTTLLKLMLGQLNPSKGQITVMGKPLQQLSLKQRAQTMAFVSQHHALYDDLRVKDVVKMGRLAGHSLLATISDDEVQPYLAQVHLEALADRWLSSLSGGQQQRVWIATALAQEPQILILDEPTTYLDVGRQQELMTLIQELQRALHMTIVMVLHDINQALTVSDQVWLMKQGQLVADRPASACYDTTLLQAVFGLDIRIIDLEQYGPYVIQVPSND